MIRQSILISLLVILLTSSIAFAHKVRIFAYEENGTIIGETAFSGGRSPKDVEILVENPASGEQLLTTRTDATGKFSFLVPELAREQHIDLQIIVNVGEGHRNSWLLEAADYLPDVQTSTTAQTAVNTVSSPKVVPTDTTSPLSSPEYSVINSEQLRLIIDESVSKQLSPIKRMLAESREQKTSLKDILGGIGYIIGLLGMAAYMQARKGGRK